MSKSILVIDAPSGCVKCRLYDYVPSRCFIMDKFQNNISDDYKPDWCPLKDFPENKPEVEYRGNGCFGINEAMQHNYNMGFNACIDEILKGDVAK